MLLRHEIAPPAGKKLSVWRCCAALIGVIGSAQAANLSMVVAPPVLEEVMIIGSREAASQVAGSGALIERSQIEEEVATDINQLLRTVPGIYVQEEDGFGLRPNIGIRGATSERSSKITLLEDGVLMAPAPYAAPAAYYFPTTARMHAIEVLKGASLLRYGPQTTGGVLNLVSTPIPQSTEGRMSMTLGEYGQQDALISWGTTQGEWGTLIETTQRRGDGFKQLAGSARDTGYHIQDYVAKARWQGANHRVSWKSQYSRERSNETYLGLTSADFERNPNRRYGLSSPDQMRNSHQSHSLSWEAVLNDRLTLETVLYRNTFHRDWFKLSGGGAWISAAQAGDADALAVLRGEADAFDLSYKHNNRRYQSQGIQVTFAGDFDRHQWQFGVRRHDDQVDFYQPTERWHQIDGEMTYNSTLLPTGSNNRLQFADAWSAWFADSWQLSDRLRVDVALRLEDVATAEQRFNDPNRLERGASKHNSSREWLPGVAALYQLSDEWQLIAGVHRGFSPLDAGASAEMSPETSVNWEAGVRFDGALFFEAIAFYSDFTDKSENCSNAHPCSNGATMGAYETGEAVISGLEVQGRHVFTQGDYQIPVALAWTHTRAEIDRDDSSREVAAGDRLPSVPETTLSLRFGVESAQRWAAHGVLKYTDQTCVQVGCQTSVNPWARTESYWVLDLVGSVALSERLSLFAKVENAFDQQAVVSRIPDGARPNKPLTASVGAEFLF
jgi:Fe(3+) dicitrate transport protein